MTGPAHIPLPDRRPAAERVLLDTRMGLLTRVDRYRASSRMPAAWVGWSARAADSSAFADWQGERYGFGAALADHDRARRAAVGEAVERYCGNAVASRLPIASYQRLIDAGRDALDPLSFALYSPQQYASPGFPFVPFTRDLPVAWVTGMDLHTGEPVLVPASMAYLNYYRGTHASEPPVHAMLYAGIAAGEDRRHAERFALEELFERDANTIWWASGAVAAGVDATDLLERYDVDGSTAGRRIRMLHVPSQFPVPVVAAFIDESTDALVAYGTACRSTPDEAAKKALVEALSMLELTAEIADPDSAHWTAVARGELPQHTYRPVRPDRRYADDFRGDWHDLVDLPAVAQLYLDPRMHTGPLDRLRPTGTPQPLSDLPSVHSDPGTAYLAMLAEAGLRAVSVDVTTDDVRVAGLTVVRVIVPGLYGNAAAAFPFLGGERLYRVPEQAGFADRPLTAADLYPYPIPHI